MTADPIQQNWWKSDIWPGWMHWRLKAVICVAMSTRWGVKGE